MTFPSTAHFSPDERKAIYEIGDRIWTEIPGANKTDLISWIMDIIAVHAKTPLDLDRLLRADAFNFAHDVLGINHHLNRETCELDGRFLPRFAKTA